jgi:acyl-CoA dehydrogenase
MFAALMKYLKDNRFLPSISETERQALEAGHPWIESEFFSGNPDFAKMLAEPYNTKLTDEEQAFIDGPCEQLCKLFDRYEVEKTHVVPQEAIQFIKDQGFMGLLIPKEQGGKGFSKLAISTVMHKLLPYSFAVCVFVMIPNSLGAGELINWYGTEEQKKHYQPLLASGFYVPSFGLTELTAGSDAAGIKAEGVVFQDGNQIKMRLNFSKRFITLAPVCNLATIATRLRDPENLLGKGEFIDTTCVLVHEDTPGFTHGRHHMPIGEAFENGTLVGENVEVPVDNIIGGPAMAGEGWRMLMEQLAGGRMISLPAGAVGNIKVAAAATSAYARVRQQFGMAIGNMEGVEEKVAFIAAMAYACEAARVFGCSAVDNGIDPPVTSAILKAYTTELARQGVTAGMDVFAGAGVQQGPRNVLSKMYRGAPVGITVEGANILTRTLIIFGQGATRCHPYAKKLTDAADNNDVAAFRAALLGFTGHIISSNVRNVTRGVTRGRTVRVPDVDPATKTYYQRLGWAGTHFSVLTDLAMITMGGKLKAKGALTGKYADALAWMLLSASALRRYEAEGRRREDLPIVQYVCEYALSEIQKAFEGIYHNFDAPVLKWIMPKMGLFIVRMNQLGMPPTISRAHQVAKTQELFNDQFRFLYRGMYFPPEDELGLGRLMKAFRLITETREAEAKILKAQKAKILPRGVVPGDLVDQALSSGVISGFEAEQLKKAHAARLDAYEVDTVSHDDYYGPQK